MDDLILHGEFFAISAATHPRLAHATITFCDDRPNANGYGIEYEDFEELKKTIVGIPIKMKFLGSSVGTHKGAIPIGYINSVEEAEENGIHKLNVDALLFADDYPEEIEYLREAFAEGKAPGVSYELGYKKELIKEGIKWIKGIVARAATFVRNPAYGTRTALLALASDQTITPEDFLTELVALANNNNGNPNTDKGGTKIMTDEEIRKLQEELAAAKTALAEKTTALETKVTELATLTQTNETLTASVKEKEEKIAEFEGKEILASRQAKLAEAGITLEIKPERLAKMAEEDFNEYVEDLKTVSASKKEKKLIASITPRIPRVTGSNNDGDKFGMLRERMAKLSDPAYSAETE